MRFERLSENCIFVEGYELEPLFVAFRVLTGNYSPDSFDTEMIKSLKCRYHFLFETFETLKKLDSVLLFDFIPDVIEKKFTLKSFLEYILSVPESERVFRMIDGISYEITEDEVKGALKSDKGLDALYALWSDKCDSYLGFATIIRQSKKIYKDLFELAKEIDTKELKAAYKEKEEELAAFKEKIVNLLNTGDGMATSEALMEKTFRNRGPYEYFYFMPSLMFPLKKVRFFYENGTPHNRLVLIYNILENEEKPENTVKTIKALGDETRYNILAMLAKEGHLNGREIAARLDLTPATISHHMLELKEAGLITEEPVKNSKYYGANKEKIGRMLENLKKDLIR
ncbi:MAG: winged helix-turn-helix transcriptional regulator [Lachnospiraceae bacterium]|nr:winged helix-turn-helix transcriptional regulator [Lachnospiraceae bacterium]